MYTQRTLKRSGAVTVELAIVLPIIFGVLFSSIDFSRANMIRNTVDNAAFEAARFATIPGATEAEITAKAQEVLDVLSLVDAQIVVIPAVITDESEQVTVQISVDLGKNLYAASQMLSGKMIVRSFTLTREQFAVELLQ